MNETYGGLIENPIDERDFDAELIVGETSDIPETQDFPPEALTLQVQSSVSCTAHGATNALEAQYYALTGVKIKVDSSIVEGDMMAIDAEEQWNYQKNTYPKTFIPGVGDYTRSACKALVYRSENGGIPAIRKRDGERIFVYVKSYAQCKKTEIKNYLSQGYAIFTSCNVTRVGTLTNWYYAKRDGVLKIEGSYVTGHAFCIIPKYDKEGVYGCNSYGQTWGKNGNGTFLLPWDQAGNLQTCWILVLDLDSNIPNIERARIKSRNSSIWTLAQKNIDSGHEQLLEKSKQIQQLAHEMNEEIRKLDS